MDFTKDSSQLERARAFAEREVAGSVSQRDRETRWEGALFKRLGAAGLLGAVLPRSAGGEESPASRLADLLSGFAEGSGDAGLALAWAAQLAGCAVPLWRLGSDPQRQRYLPALARGEWVGALAHHERLAAPEPSGVRTTAVRRGGQWVLNGTKSWVVNGPVADVFVITAVTDAARGRDGISSFLLERSTPGLCVGRRLETLGMRTATFSELVLEDCAVSDGALLGAPGTGLTRTWRLIQRWQRVALFAPWVGLLKALLERCVVAARERLHYGRPLAQSQAARATLGDMRIRYELSARLLARAAWHLERDEAQGEQDIAVAALYVSESIRSLVGAAVQLNGLEGTEVDGLTERLYRDAGVMAALGGAQDVLRPALAGALVGLG